MTPVQKIYQKNQELMRSYVKNHKEMRNFVNAFTEVQKANQDGRRVNMNISIGESKKKGFFTYLINRVKNPNIIFTSFKEKNGRETPQINIGDDTSVVSLISVDKVKIISYEIENDDNDCTFDRYNFVLHYTNKFDYDIIVVIYKE